MKFNKAPKKVGPVTAKAVLLLLAGSSWILGAVHHVALGSIPVAIGIGAAVVGQQQIDPTRVVGRDACKQCHQFEFEAWSASAHGQKAWELLSHPKAPDFAKELGIAAGDIQTSMCTNCHGTPQVKDGSRTISHGNSCESCHGAAGGADGWYKRHSDFGTASTTMDALLKDRLQESPEALASRQADCTKAGMNQSENVFGLAKNCLACHSVPNEQLIDAGHPTSDKFEFVEWAQGEVRHNFLLASATNANVSSLWMSRGTGRTDEGRLKLMYVSGQLADLVVSLRNRANVTSTKRNSLGDAANDRILDAIKELGKLKIPELKPILEIAEKNNIDKAALKDVAPDDKARLNGVADEIEKACTAFAQAVPDGNGLPSIRLPKKAKGDVFKES